MKKTLKQILEVNMPIVKTVKVEGLTKIGKNRVREHGDEWHVVDHTVNTKNVTGTLLKSVKTGHERWQGHDFKIIE